MLLWALLTSLLIIERLLQIFMSVKNYPRYFFDARLPKQKPPSAFYGQWLRKIPFCRKSPYPLKQMMTIMLMLTKIFATATLPPVNIISSLSFVCRISFGFQPIQRLIQIIYGCQQKVLRASRGSGALSSPFALCGLPHDPSFDAAPSAVYPQAVRGAVRSARLCPHLRR